MSIAEQAISVILTANGDAKALSRLMTALVPAAAEGLVREVAVVGAEGASALVADDAGADLYDAGAFAEAFQRARGPWVAGLPLVADLIPSWMELVIAHQARDVATPARLVTVGGGFSLGTKPEGWLTPKHAASVAAAEQDLQRLARSRGALRLRILSRR